MRARVIIATLAVLAAAPAAGQDEPAARVRIAIAEVREIAPTIGVPATVVSRHDSNVAAEAAGRVTFVAEAGDVVVEGDPVATIDDAEARLALAEAEARVRRLEVSLAQQSRDVGRREELTSRGTLPESQLDEMTARRDMTAMELREARIALERADVDLARATVAAPFTGLVVERLIEVGEYATPGADVARLVDVADLEARAQAPVDVARFMREGDTLEIAGAGETREAPIRTIIAAGDAITRTFEIRLDVSATDWLIGAPVRVRVPSDTPRSSVCVPRDALILRADGAFVMRVDADNIAHRVAVTPGAGQGEWIEIGEALAPGDRVIVRGAERLRDGQAVEPLNEPEARPAVATSDNAPVERS